MLRAAVATPTKLSGLLESAFRIPQRHVLFMSNFVKLWILRKLNIRCKPDSLFIWGTAAVRGEGRCQDLQPGSEHAVATMSLFKSGLLLMKEHPPSLQPPLTRGRAMCCAMHNLGLCYFF